MGGRRRAVFALALACALAVASCSSSSDDDTSTETSKPKAKPPAYATELQSEIPQVMEANAIPGAVVLIRSRDQGNWSSAFGTKAIDSDEPIAIDDYFRIGSNTKTMTATVILQLVQEGKLSLDDPLSKYVAGFPNGDQITIGELAEMRSGLDAYTSVPRTTRRSTTIRRRHGRRRSSWTWRVRWRRSSRRASSTATRTPTTRCSASSSSS